METNIRLRKPCIARKLHGDTVRKEQAGRIHLATRKNWGAIRKLPSGKILASYIGSDGRRNSPWNIQSSTSQIWQITQRVFRAHVQLNLPCLVLAERTSRDTRALAERPYSNYSMKWGRQEGVESGWLSMWA
jgi:hypothetical protein